MDPYLELALAEGCGPGLVASLLDPDADPRELLASPPRRLPPSVRRRLESVDLTAEAVALRALASRLDIDIWTAADPRYPTRLRQAPLRPLALFARGDATAARGDRPAVAIVGSRTPTPYGEAAARDFCRALAEAGCVVWSGLAYGVDAIAHETALDAGAPTVAVLAGGLDAPHPTGNEALAARILAEHGLWLSESPPGLRPSRGHFPRRNRILAGAVDAILVVEAGERSGTLHTARFAVEGGVPVFVVPGPYTSPRSRGCHRLLEDGADLAADPAALLRRLGVACALHGRHDVAQGLELGADTRTILDVLACGPRPIDTVQRECGLDDARFLELLFGMIAGGTVVRLAGNLLGVGRSRR